jgi:hypothetical protein
VKKILQLAVLVTIALLAMQPAFAGQVCAQGMPVTGGCVPGCTMAMSQMGADCPMSLQVTSTDCEQNCCSAGLPLGVAQSATGVNLKAGRTVYFAAVLQPIADAGAVCAATPPSNLDSTAPARYILFHVFRI